MKLIKHLNKRKIELIVLSILVLEFVFPHYGLAAGVTSVNQSVLLPNMVIKSSPTSEKLVLADIIEQETVIEKVAWTKAIPVTAYNSLPGQTDSTPCITANGYNLCEANEENVIAANFLPFGTKVRIPELFGDRIFTVQDRMNARYYYRADIWMRDHQDAIKFGLKYVTIEVLE